MLLLSSHSSFGLQVNLQSHWTYSSRKIWIEHVSIERNNILIVYFLNTFVILVLTWSPGEVAKKPTKPFHSFTYEYTKSLESCFSKECNSLPSAHVCHLTCDLVPTCWVALAILDTNNPHIFLPSLALMSGGPGAPRAGCGRKHHVATRAQSTLATRLLAMLVLLADFRRISLRADPSRSGTDSQGALSSYHISPRHFSCDRWRGTYRIIIAPAGEASRRRRPRCPPLPLREGGVAGRRRPGGVALVPREQRHQRKRVVEVVTTHTAEDRLAGERLFWAHKVQARRALRRTTPLLRDVDVATPRRRRSTRATPRRRRRVDLPDPSATSLW